MTRRTLSRTLAILLLADPVGARAAGNGATGGLQTNRVFGDLTYGRVQTPSGSQTLQQALASGGGGSGIQAQGGNVSNTVRTSILPGAVSRSVAAAAADVVSVKEFGAAGNAFVVPLSADVASGAATLPFAAGTLPALTVGESVQGNGIPTGATVGSFTSSSVTLAGSVTLNSAEPLGGSVFFAPTDDAPAFVKAEAAIGNAGTIYVPPGVYWLQEAVPQTPGIRYVLDGASFTTASTSVPNFADQSMVQGLLTHGISAQFGSLGQQATEVISAYAPPVTSHVSYQDNAQEIRLTNAQPYTTWTDNAGASHTASHDQVGQFIIAEHAGTNTNGATWDTNWVLGIDAGSNGGAILQEAQVINNRTSPVTEVDSVNTISGYDWIFNGASRSTYALFLQGNATGGGPGLENGIVARYGSVKSAVLAIRVAGYQNASGVVTTHTDYARIFSDGSIFGQSLHVGGGQTTGDVLPTAGFTVDANGNVLAPTATVNGVLNAPGFSVNGNPSGAVVLGNKTTTTYPTIDFYQDGNGDDCQIRGAGGSNLDFFCGNANGLTNDLIMYAGGMAFQVSPSFPSISTGSGESDFATSGTQSDPDPGVARDIKARNGGIATTSLKVSGATNLAGNTMVNTMTVSGSVTVPTRAPGDSTTNAASTAFVTAAISAAGTSGGSTSSTPPAPSYTSPSSLTGVQNIGAGMCNGNYQSTDTANVQYTVASGLTNCRISFIQGAAGQISFVGVNGVTVNALGGSAVSAGQWATVVLKTTNAANILVLGSN